MWVGRIGWGECTYYNCYWRFTRVVASAHDAEYARPPGVGTSDPRPASRLTPNDRVDFELLHASPVLSNGWSLLGETRKWVPVTSQRVAAVSQVGSGLEVEVHGAVGEAVALSFAFSSEVAAGRQLAAGARLPVTTVTCTLPESGMARLSMPSKACAPLGRVSAPL